MVNAHQNCPARRSRLAKNESSPRRDHLLRLARDNEAAKLTLLNQPIYRFSRQSEAGWRGKARERTGKRGKGVPGSARAARAEGATGLDRSVAAVSARAEPRRREG